jgi:cAMP-binding proteins - catabolite gene activator and regulatory subunit of cAMP-dependent protein kinases
MVQERRFVSDLSLLAAAHCGYCDHRSIALQQMNVQTLRHVPLFESLDTETAHELCQLLDSLDCKAGAVLFRTGDEGDAMYLIEQGKVRICVRAKDGHEVTLTELHRGDFFGEMALFDGKPRSADARVAEDARLAVLSREHFLSFVSATQMSRWRCLQRLPIGYATQMNFCAHCDPQRQCRSSSAVYPCRSRGGSHRRIRRQLEIYYCCGGSRQRLGMDKHVVGMDWQNQLRSVSVLVAEHCD